VSSFTTLVSHILDLRARNLEGQLADMLGDAWEALKENANIAQHKRRRFSLFSRGTQEHDLFDAIASPDFAKAAVALGVGALEAPEGSTPSDQRKALLERVGVADKEIRKKLDELTKSNGKETLEKKYGDILNLLTAVGVDARGGLKQVEDWFDSVMANISEIYKQKVRLIVWPFALAVVLVFNVDSIAIAKAFWNNPDARDAVIAQVDVITQSSAETDQEQAEQEKTVDELLADLNKLQIPLMWFDQDGNYNFPQALDWEKALGLLITWVAAAQGSHFWYDQLRKLRPAVRTSSEPASTEGG